MTPTVWFVGVNPSAGTRVVAPEHISNVLADHGVEAVVVTTRDVAELGREVVRAASDGFVRFAGVGGDGTLHHLVNAVFAAGVTRPLIALIPAGSGSDFIRTFALEPTIEAGVERLADPTPYAIDVGVVEGAFGTRYFVNALNAGVAAASVERARRLPRRVGSLRYTVAFWLALGGFRQAPIVVAVDRHRFEGRAINVVVANGQYFGGGMNIAPRASLVDGTFDVQVFSGPRRNAFVVMPRLVFGAHLTHRAVRRYLGEVVDIEAPDDWPIEADGELLGTGSVTVRTISSAADFAI